ncbi:hydrolase [Gracilibacillus sp. YIM 98692]|uniref:ComEC/Rec2 family competence protein n=1 Tax=Gracilibacillus sp. YIM 98692 TaxID=2663532 RepID=UPI0013D5357F|nr:hydrolase [Gracilibacillus sp. YIM 98692]
MRAKVWFGLLCVWICYIFSITPVYTSVTPSMNTGEVDVVFFNVPHGEATLLTNSKGEHILINTASRKSQKNLAHQMKELGVSHIDMLILTNHSEEYSGNVHYFMKYYGVEEILLPNHASIDTPHDVTVTNWTLEKNITVWENLTIEPIDQSQEGDISFLLTYGDETILFLNNKNTSVEKKLLSIDLQVDILKIAGFGNGFSPTQHFLEHIDPYMSIIFHSQKDPINEELVERLNATWIDVYFLKQTGTVFVRITEKDYEILS